MEGKRLTMLDLLVETHIGLERQGPGSPEATTRALSFVENPGAIRRTADLVWTSFPPSSTGSTPMPKNSSCRIG